MKKEQLATIAEELTTANAELSKKRGGGYRALIVEDRADAFYEGWLVCLKELGTPFDHPVLVAAKPPMAYPNLSPTCQSSSQALLKRDILVDL
ncbi:hypothetical protein Acr_27g0000300 [Actinidia rufa]|uniref:Uncharacterized protein n=1 Tax=Actinidia rufa TaxID=165716 RepID=A0A7J0H5I5_9ERIC|nr:hypothetical protein Acr_27g0000300 [Actinidia rufa]